MGVPTIEVSRATTPMHQRSRIPPTAGRRRQTCRGRCVYEASLSSTTVRVQTRHDTGMLVTDHGEVSKLELS